MPQGSLKVSRNGDHVTSPSVLPTDTSLPSKPSGATPSPAVPLGESRREQLDSKRRPLSAPPGRLGFRAPGASTGGASAVARRIAGGVAATASGTGDDSFAAEGKKLEGNGVEDRLPPAPSNLARIAVERSAEAIGEDRARFRCSSEGCTHQI